MASLLPRMASLPAANLGAPSPAALELLGALGQDFSGRVSTLDQDRLMYARDMWPMGLLLIRQGRTPPPPDAVVWPKSEEELAALVKLARERKVPLIPFGAGSGVCGGTWAVSGGIAVDLKLFDAVGKVDPDALTVEAGAGVIGEVLERKLNAQGYTLGHFPSSIWMSTLGGWMAARSAGQLSNKYGKIEDMVLSARAVTGRGERVVTPQRPFHGPDLAQLLIGSEGTLCFFTGAKLRVHPAPSHRAFRGFRFRTVADGVEAIRQLYRAGLRPAVVRLYDPFDTALVGRGKPEAHGDLPPSLRSRWRRDVMPSLLRRVSPRTLGNPRLMNKAADLLKHCLLILLFEGERQRATREEEHARQLALEMGAEDLGEGPGKSWFVRRYDVSYKMSKVVDAGAFADTMEVATTWDKVMAVYEGVWKATAPLAFTLCHFSHAYPEGCSLYFSFVASEASEDAQQARYAQLWEAAMTAAREAGANVSHHHGVGVLKAAALQEELGEGRKLLAALKKVFDPDGIMNPGKLGL